MARHAVLYRGVIMPTVLYFATNFDSDEHTLLYVYIYTYKNIYIRLLWTLYMFIA